MDLTHGGGPRRLVWAGVVAGAAATLCLAALTGQGHGSTRGPSRAGGIAGRAAQLAPGPAVAASQLAAGGPAVAASQLAAGGPAATAARLAAAGLGGHAAPAARRARPNPWLINPDAPLPRLSPWRLLLLVARRFAVAYLSYEVGELGSAVRRTIIGTCTAVFAAQLLADRASLPPGVRAGQVRQRLVALAPLERVLGVAVTLVTVRSGHSARTTSAFELRLVRGPSHPRAWRVAGITVL